MATWDRNKLIVDAQLAQGDNEAHFSDVEPWQDYLAQA